MRRLLPAVLLLLAACADSETDPCDQDLVGENVSAAEDCFGGPCDALVKDPTKRTYRFCPGGTCMTCSAFVEVDVLYSSGIITAVRLPDSGGDGSSALAPRVPGQIRTGAPATGSAR